MKLVTGIQNRMYEELPGYLTVYGGDGVSIGVALMTDYTDYFWYVGDDTLQAKEVPVDDLKHAAAVFGEPETCPIREDAPVKAEYDSSAVLVKDLNAEFTKYEAAVLDVVAADAEAVWTPTKDGTVTKS